MISILFLSADPSDQTRLRLGEEAREIEEKLRLSRQRDNFDFIMKFAVRPPDISQAMLDVEPNIVHFSGHGNDEGALCVETVTGHTLPISAEALAGLFENFADQLNCVVLNACYSAVQAKAIARHIPYVIGMSREVADLAAISFSIGFYQALGAGRSIEQAFNLGVALIRMQGIPDNLVPQMLKMEHGAVKQVETRKRPHVDTQVPQPAGEPEGTPQVRPEPRIRVTDAKLMADLRAILDNFGIESDHLTPNMRFNEDLEMDSLDLVELIMAVEDQYNFEISDEEALGISTIGEGMAFVKRKLGQR